MQHKMAARPLRHTKGDGSRFLIFALHRDAIQYGLPKKSWIVAHIQPIKRIISMNIRNQIQHIRVGMINADRKLWIFFSRLCISRWFFSSGSIAITCGGAFPRSCKNVWNANEFSPQKAPQSTRQSFCSRFPHSAFLSWLFSLQCGKIRVRKFILICTTTVWKSLHRAECTK